MALVLTPEERQRLDELITRCLAGNIETTPLCEASSEGDAVSVLALLRLGVDIYDRNCFGRTPLMYAAHKGHLSVAKTLLEAGADVHPRRLFGLTALHDAAKNGHTGIVIALLSAQKLTRMREQMTTKHH